MSISNELVRSFAAENAESFRLGWLNRCDEQEYTPFNNSYFNAGWDFADQIILGPECRLAQKSKESI